MEQPDTLSGADVALLALDWGTSSLRGACLDAQGRVLQERQFAHGILNVPAGGFARVFEECFGDWARAAAGHARARGAGEGPPASSGPERNVGTRTGAATGPRPLCLISGMAGSRQGWVEAAYCACPAGLADLAARLLWIDDPALPLPTAIVPGLRCAHASTVPGLASVPDVMRGEEVQVFGAMALAGWREGLCILPGTHSKWAWVRDGRVQSFRTYMTGEFYALLGRQSLLARTLDLQAPFDPPAFALGLARAREGAGLLHDAFGTRTLALFERMSAGALASYLSGLVIGEELRGLDASGATSLTLVGSDTLTERYALACNSSGIPARRMGSEATWAGLRALALHLSPGT